MKYAAFKLAGSHCLFLWHGRLPRLPRCASPRTRFPTRRSSTTSKIDPSLDLKVVELTSGVNANELLASGDVDANYFQHVPYLKDQEKRWVKPLPSRPPCILSRWEFTRISIKISHHCRKTPPWRCRITPPT